LHIYPNPASDFINISFDLKTDTKVKLEIYNGAGQLIDILSEEQLLPGKHSRNYNISGLPSGVYMVILKTKTGTETKKIIIG